MGLILILLAILYSSKLTSQIGVNYEGTDCKTGYNGTTHDLKEIVIGRCHEFFNTIHKDDCNFVSSNYNCEHIWDIFRGTVVNKDPCYLKTSDFDTYLAKVDHKIETNRSLFWSGTYSPAHEISKHYKFYSLEDTLSGFLLNSLSFCSNSGLNTFNNESCPWMCSMVNSAYWNAASAFFARKAHGHVQVILNGTRTTGAINSISTFYNYELPLLNASSISLLKIILLHNLDKEKYETCDNPKSLKLLTDSLTDKGIKYKCEDNPDNIIALFCFQDPYSKECQAIKFNINRSVRNTNNLFTLILNYIIVQFILFSFLNN